MAKAFQPGQAQAEAYGYIFQEAYGIYIPGVGRGAGNLYNAFSRFGG